MGGLVPHFPNNTIATTDKVCDLEAVGLSMLFEEFLLRHSRHNEDDKWITEFKAQLRALSGDANVYRFRGKVVFTDDRNGRFAAKQLEAVDPDLYGRYVRIVVEEKFDEEAFHKDHPDLWESLRAQRFLVK